MVWAGLYTVPCHWISLNHCSIYHWALLIHSFISIKYIVPSLHLCDSICVTPSVTRKQPYWVAERIGNSVGFTVLRIQIVKMLKGFSRWVKGSMLSVWSARGMIWHCVIDGVSHPICKLSKILISQPVACFSWLTNSRTSHNHCRLVSLCSSKRRVRRCLERITLF